MFVRLPQAPVPDWLFPCVTERRSALQHSRVKGKVLLCIRAQQGFKPGRKRGFKDVFKGFQMNFFKLGRRVANNQENCSQLVDIRWACCYVAYGRVAGVPRLDVRGSLIPPLVCMFFCHGDQSISWCYMKPEQNVNATCFVCTLCLTVCVFPS